MKAAMIIAFVAGVLLGNYDGDRQTLIDCATAGQAEMAGGGMISCRVVTL